MSKKLIGAALIVMSCSAMAGDKPHWGYSGKGSPSNWAKLSSEYSMCDGSNQSPVNLTNFVEAELPPIDFSYEVGGKEIVNNGHTIQVNYDKGSYIKVDGDKFNLLQFHFHSPSENHINGKSFPLEGHLVHANKKGELAVVAVMFDVSSANKGMKKAWANMPAKAGNKYTFKNKLNVDEFLPKERDYYRFNGSLTTPPCSEGVRWLVLKNKVPVTKEQVSKFHDTFHHDTNRPIQATNARVILQ